MNTYQKLATFILRCIGAFGTAYLALVWLQYATRLVSGDTVPQYPLPTLIGNGEYFVLSLGLLLGAPPLGRLLGRGLD